MIKIGDEIKVIGINKDDAHYSDRKNLIGMIGIVIMIEKSIDNKYFYRCQIDNVKNQDMDMYYFKQVKIKKLKHE